METACAGGLRPWGLAPDPTRDQSLDPLPGLRPDPSPRGQGKVQQHLSSQDRIIREPCVKGLSRHKSGEVPPHLFHGSLDTRLRSWLYGGIFLQLWDGLMTRADQKALSVWHAVCTRVFPLCWGFYRCRACWFAKVKATPLLCQSNFHSICIEGWILLWQIRYRKLVDKERLCVVLFRYMMYNKDKHWMHSEDALRF